MDPALLEGEVIRAVARANVDTLSARIVALTAATLVLIAVLEAVRRRKLLEEYTPIWITCAMAILWMSLSPRTVLWVTDAVGAWTPSSAVFFLGLAFLMAISLGYAIRLSALSTQVRILSRELALLKMESGSHREGEFERMTKESEPTTLAEREQEFFARYYGDQAYNLRGWRLRMRRDLRQLLHESAGRPLGRVLSYGCGDGLFELAVASHAEHVTGLDLSRQAVDLAGQNARARGIENVAFQCARAEEFEDAEGFDTILCIALLHHLPEAALPGFLEAIRARLRPDGLVYGLDPNVHAISRKLGRVVLGRRYDAYHSPDERELDPREIARLLRESGFERVRILPCDWTLIPATYLLASGPDWPLYLCAGIDRMLSALPLSGLASGFAFSARPGAPQ